MSERTKTVTLGDGRSLAWDEHGDPDGQPLLLFHGTPGSRLFRYPDATVTSTSGLRIITVDRPGCGASDPLPGRRLLAWPDDVIQLADALAIDRFIVAGISGGGAYAAACALRIPERVRALGLISAAGPMDIRQVRRATARARRTRSMLARRVPWLLRRLLKTQARAIPDDPQQLARAIARSSPSGDKEALQRAGVPEMFTANLREAFRQGPQGVLDDLRVLGGSWGFDLEDLDLPVYLWHGEQDDIVPIATARYMADAIPDCTATYYEDEGHMLMLNRWPEIAAVLRH